MRTFLLGIAALAAVTAAPASAAVVIGFGNVSTNENVLFASSTAVTSPSLVANTNQSGVAVTFANALGLLANASGQSSTTNGDGVLIGLTSVTIANGFTFAAAQFNLNGIPGNPPPAEASNVFVEALGLGGAVIGSQNLLLDGAGENRIGISGTLGEVFTGFRVTLTPSGAGVDSLSQVRLGGVGAVPEPATWMMMLVGFGVVGSAMRRRRTVASFA